MGRSAKLHSVSTRVRGVECPVVDIRAHVLAGLVHRECERSRPLHGDCRVQVVSQFLAGHDIPKRVCRVGSASGDALCVGVVCSRTAFRLYGRKTEPGVLNQFLVVLVRGLDIEQVRVLLLVFVVFGSKPPIDARPECLPCVQMRSLISSRIQVWNRMLLHVAMQSRSYLCPRGADGASGRLALLL